MGYLSMGVRKKRRVFFYRREHRVYKNIKLDCGYRMDLVEEDSVVVEIKPIEAIAPIHKAQSTSYLRLSGYKVGLLINFYVIKLKDGFVRIVNDFPGTLRSPRSLR